MLVKNLKIISQQDAIHKSFVEELMEHYPEIQFQSIFIGNSESEILSNTPILEQINDKLAVLNLEVLPFPLAAEIKIVSVMKSEKNNGYFALLSKDAKDSLYSDFTEQSIQHQFGKVYLAGAGEVGNRENWHKAFQTKPKILFTGYHIAKYAHLGYVYHHAMIEITDLDDYREVDNEIANIKEHQWLIFTSSFAVEHFFKRLLEIGKDSRYLSQLKVASIGTVTSGKLKKYGIIPDLQTTEESSEGLVKLFKKEGINSAKILIPRSNLAINFLPEALVELGNIVKKLVVYKNQLPNNIKKVEVESFDQVIFTSPSGVDNFIKIYGKLPQKPEIVTRGKETAKRVESYKV